MQSRLTQPPRQLTFAWAVLESALEDMIIVDKPLQDQTEPFDGRRLLRDQRVEVKLHFVSAACRSSGQGE